MQISEFMHVPIRLFLLEDQQTEIAKETEPLTNSLEDFKFLSLLAYNLWPHH